MKVYKVGGAVRDQLLKRPVSEIDWVVVGSTPAELMALGYTPVGKDFPVFLHPQTKQEYALARLERKIAMGYHGFTTDHSPAVTLEQDLSRRDLTINAMAQADDGQIIDPYGGRADLTAKLLRHVSPAFVEDPVRILRVARFLARFEPLGFSVAPDTLHLMRSMVQAGEVNALQAERVASEMQRALQEPHPVAFFSVLRDVGALAIILPEVERLFGVPQPPQWHPEVDTGIHAFMALQSATQLSDSPRVRFAALVHDVGKGLTPPEQWPRHIGHETLSAQLVESLCRRLRLPNDYRELAVMVAKWHTLCHQAMVLTPLRMLKLLDEADIYRRFERFEEFLLACSADFFGRKDFATRRYPQAELLKQVALAAKSVKTDELNLSGLTGPAIAKALHAKRLSVITPIIEQARQAHASANP
jgi:tRNA nucleotidyltransferase (CCA-adding enzyme)